MTCSNGAVVARLAGSTVRLEGCECNSSLCASLEKHGYLQRGTLDPLEAAYQIASGRIELYGCGSGWRCALKAIPALSIRLDELIVYMNLRRRGRKPQRGFRKHTLLYDHQGRTYEVLILSEGRPVRLGSLIEWSRQAVADNHVPIIAVVDRTGVVTFYEARASKSIQ